MFAKIFCLLLFTMYLVEEEEEEEEGNVLK